ncbi:MAG TPA: NAD(+) diphosphatase [Stellaceae bacterium]|nr:NAD(+) diphosphatase [Stellaceae bacterium]
MPDTPPKSANFYAGGLDRASHLRKDAAWLAERLPHATSRFVPVWRGQNLIADYESAAPHGVFLPPEAIAAADYEIVLLGIESDGAYFAVDLSAMETPLDTIKAPELWSQGPPAAFSDLRRVGPLLPRHEASLLAFARGMSYWHSRHRFCGVCGSPTRGEEAGHVRRCTNEACNAPHFPRTDPAVIMLVHDRDERCLLGRQAAWPQGMHSTLAGFVEPGESLEEAVAREVYEETSVTLASVTYHSSQPWPFPASLMLGFHAEAKSTEIVVDQTELEAAHWYEKSWLLAHQDDEHFRLPRRDSIARRLLEDWLRR